MPGIPGYMPGHMPGIPRAEFPCPGNTRAIFATAIGIAPRHASGYGRQIQNPRKAVYGATDRAYYTLQIATECIKEPHCEMTRVTKMRDYDDGDDESESIEDRGF